MISDNNPVLRGPFLYLRRARRRDSKGWVALRRVSRDFLQPWEPRWDTKALTPRGYRMFLAYHRKSWRDETMRGFLLFHNDSHELLGGITLSRIQYGVSMNATLGYWIGKPHARKGYMREAIILILDYAFGVLKLNRVEATCMPNNRPSARLLQKNGFKIEGEASAYLYIDGAWEDHFLYALLARDSRPRLPQLEHSNRPFRM